MPDTTQDPEPSDPSTPPDPLPPIEAVKDRGWRELSTIDAAHRRGEIDDDGWFAAVGAFLVPAYLAGDNPRAQSGHGGDEVRWESARRHIVRAIDSDCDFLDVGCASGLLMESVRRWAAEDGHRVEPYGLDIAPELADLARRRLPHWADRIWVGNALTWRPPRRFDVVRTGLDYVPPPRRGDLVRHLLDHVVGRRLVIGSDNEDRNGPWYEDEVVALGYVVAGRAEVPHPDPRVVRRVFWIDRP